jgi:hypothetical protein
MAMTPLAGWQNFYVIVGSSAGALIGLQFVVLSLMSDKADAAAGSAYATPTILHFGVVLGLSAILCAPWGTLAEPSVLWGLVGTAGVVYTLIVMRRMRSESRYRPQFEDWLFHVVLPCAAYLVLALSAALASFYSHEAPFGIGASTLTLLFCGIHNAWDAVTYHMFVRSREHGPPKQRYRPST